MLKYILSIFCLTLISLPAVAQVEVGKLAPNFTATDAVGTSVSLDQFRGKIVVLEWTNPECPFVVKHYSGGHMQNLQKEVEADGVVWLSINSSAEGKQGHLTPEAAGKVIADKGISAAHYLLDHSGEVGTLYGAKTTPHMFVIDAEGILVYAGAIDSVASFDSKDIEKADNYVKAALKSLQEGATIAQANTKPYGCSVKYDKDSL